MRHARIGSRLLALLALLLMTAPPAGAEEAPYTTGLVRWRAADAGLEGWQRDGVRPAEWGSLRLDPVAARPGRDPYPAGGYEGRSYYNGGDFLVGEATSPETPTVHPFTEAIASWNAETPPGTWLEMQLSVRIGGRWTAFYSLGVWATGDDAVARHSVGRQADGDAAVEVDTLVLGDRAAPADAVRLRVLLFSAGGEATPALWNAAVATSSAPVRPAAARPGDPALWERRLPVPTCSQMVYPDGGNVWCSPTSTAMVLGYWGRAGGPCEPRVRAAVAGVYDWRYRGHGNWAFNTAYAAAQGMEAYVVRFASLADLEPWIAAGVPVVISYAWRPGELTGAPLAAVAGHLGVLVGFDAEGNPIVNDPASPDDGVVQRTYRRAELEALWLERAGGTTYLIYPPGWPVPPL